MNSEIRMRCRTVLNMTLCFFLCIQGYAYARDDERCDSNTAALVMKHFNIPDSGEIRDSACKIWPYDKNKVLAVIAYAPAGYDFAVSDYPLPYYVAVIDSKASAITAGYQGGIVEDGAIQVTEYTLKWDTARYDVAAGVRGFALRVNAFRQSPAMGGGFDNQLTLFIIDGRKIRPLIRELNMHEWECDIGCGDNNAEVVEKKVEISVAKEKTNDFADLMLTLSRSDSKKVEAYRAKYNGSEYDLRGWNETQHFRP